LNDQSSELSIAANKISQLNEQLKHANKTIEILRNVNSKKIASASKAKSVKHTAAVTKYTPQIATNQPVDLKKLLADGINAEKDDAEEVAMWNYRKYLSVKPNNIDVNRRLGTILFKRGQNKEAIELLQKAYSLEPGNIAAASVYAQALIQQKKFANASEILKKAAKKQPENYKLLTSYASALAGTGKTAAALDKLADAIKISPDNPKAYLARAQIIAIYHPDLLDTAASSYRKARKLGAKPDVFLEDTLGKKLAKVDKNAEMIEFLKAPAKEAERNRDWASAAWYFGQLYKLKPDDKQYREKFAAALLLQKKYKKSLEALDLKKLSNNGKLIAASAILCQGNCSQAAALIKDAKSSKDMPEYFKAVKAKLKSAVSNTPDKKKEFARVHSQIDKLL
jgi:predicted Zn-dependent protease